jgi:transposase-like protein
MTPCGSVPELFKGRHFDHEVIVLCVRWYLSFKLSSRDLVLKRLRRGSQFHSLLLRPSRPLGTIANQATNTMQKVTPHLWFDKQAREAAE